MIDFSKLRRLTIPEGEVKQIADKSGNILWRYMEKLATPVISLETVADITKLATPTIRLDVVEDEPILPDEPIKLAAPTITLYVEPVVPDEPDIPTEPVQLTAPTIRLEVIEDEPDVPDVPEEPVKLSAPTIRLDVVEEEPDKPEIPTEPVKLAAPVISLYTEPVEPDLPVLTKLAAPTIELEVIEPIVLEVEKITDDTYAAETTYEDEQFILLDIYPEAADSVVHVTYGDLTKTLTFDGTNAQQVYFGTLYGVADEVATPASGTLTIEGGCGNFGVGGYAHDSKSTYHCSCITKVISWGDCNPTVLVDYAFYQCEKLTLDKLPSSITSIGVDSFRVCKYLALTELPSGVTSIGVDAFYGCNRLALTALPSGLTSIGEGAFRNCNNIALTSLPNGLTSIESEVFSGCSNLALTELPSGVTSIGADAFYRCTRLALTALPSGLTSIGSRAFSRYGTSSLATFPSLPSGLTSIGNYAFSDARVSQTVVIPASVGEIGINPWELRSKDVDFIVENGNESFVVEGLCLIDKAKSRLICGRNNSIIPDYITSVDAYAFYKCDLFAPSLLPSGITQIGDYAFGYCTNLALSSLPNGLTVLEEGVFSGCDNWINITIPSSVTSIDMYVFNSLLSSPPVRTITMLSETPPNVSISAFSLGEGSVIIVPTGCGETYKVTGDWEYYADYITEATA